MHQTIFQIEIKTRAISVLFESEIYCLWCLIPLFFFVMFPNSIFFYGLVNDVNVYVIILFKQAKNHLIQFLYTPPPIQTHTHTKNTNIM